MGYKSLEACILDLEKQGMLIRITDEVDPNLEMAAIHLRIYEKGGPALLFENVKGSKYRAVSNIYGTLDRSKYIFRDTIEATKTLIDVKNNPLLAIKNPFKYMGALLKGLNALPFKNPFSKPVLFSEINISDIPQIKHWPMDGGAFVTLPQVYTEDADAPGIMKANLGMYRIQLSGNDYVMNQEIGLHYQLHRGIGVHQTKANNKGIPLKVCCFVGGPPSHAVAAVMPLPEGMSEMQFAGLLGRRRFRYAYKDGYCISTDADFVITGEVVNNATKPEGPFGDHLGYYSLQHHFPVMKVHKVYARKNAIWAFTVVGRPPQEDTSFGQLIHEITGNAIPAEVPGLQEVHAVDAAGVHPLLLAVGSERYTPYMPAQQPAELLTIANHVLGKGQLSLAKFLFITASNTPEKITTHDIEKYLHYIFERIHLDRDIHFYTNTSIDTLDYSGTSINQGSKVVIAAYGDAIRTPTTVIPTCFQHLISITNVAMPMAGVVSISGIPFTTYLNAHQEIENLNTQLHHENLQDVVMIVLCDDAAFTAATLNNYLWVTYTRCNPANDMYGINSFTINKHWGCKGPLIIDARKKPHHAPELVKDAETEKKIAHFFEKGGMLERWK
jgi:4-hydroxy-3-polyprenylbenzoate decarboxylase